MDRVAADLRDRAADCAGRAEIPDDDDAGAACLTVKCGWASRSILTSTTTTTTRVGRTRSRIGPGINTTLATTSLSTRGSRYRSPISRTSTPTRIPSGRPSDAALNAYATVAECAVVVRTTAAPSTSSTATATRSVINARSANDTGPGLSCATRKPKPLTIGAAT